MYLKEFSANWLFQFQFLQICFRIRPKLSCLRMIHKLILYFFRLARSKHLSCNFFPSIIRTSSPSATARSVSPCKISLCFAVFPRRRFPSLWYSTSTPSSSDSVGTCVPRHTWQAEVLLDHVRTVLHRLRFLRNRRFPI